MTGRKFSKIQNKTYSEEIHLANSMLELTTRNGWNCNISVLFQNHHDVKPKYYSFNRFLFLTRVLSLQDVFHRNAFYFVCFLQILLLWRCVTFLAAQFHTVHLFLTYHNHKINRQRGRVVYKLIINEGAARVDYLFNEAELSNCFSIHSYPKCKL